ncbi:MAG: antirestriction protein ArdA [Oscillospiraceae bacterium]|jgi:hypothetical protein|nr:antirestriction protein ArdA [Oscillospiraceae bacterium]
MAGFTDRIQALMNDFYHELQKDENNAKSKWDVLKDFSEAHQIAVMFGNFNYQVENGGISQWIYNGYYHDDAEKLTGYLETVADTDERCRIILDRIYQIERYAREVNCDRYGYIDNPEESGFIGDAIDCDAFDTWYYEHCGKEDWWELVCGIIETAPPVVSFEEKPSPDETIVNRDEGINANKPLRVYIEHAGKPRIGGFTIPLPATPEEIQPFFEDAEIKSPQDIKIWEVRSDITGMGDIITEAIQKSVSPDSLNELNYLAAKLAAMDPNAFEIFAAAAEAKRHCGSVAELINITENLGCFDLQPAFSAEQYGEFLIDMDYDTCVVVDRLKQSKDPAERLLFKFISRLEGAVDSEKYGYNAAKEEDGVFTERGYLTENENDFKTVYCGSEGVPAEYILTVALPDHEKLVMVTGADLPTLLTELHALGGDHMRDVKHNIRLLTEGGDVFLLLVAPDRLTVTPADIAFRKDTDDYLVWVSMNPPPGSRTFVVSVTDRENDQITGNLSETDLKAIQNFITRFSISFDYIDAEMKDGSTRQISRDEWNKMELIDRDQMHRWTTHYTPEDETRLAICLDAFRDLVTENRQPVTTDELLSQLNAPFMARANHPQPDMLRLSPEAAKEILVQNTASVYRLMDDKPEKLSPMDAVKTGLNYLVNREFAIRREDLPSVEQWARRSAEAILRQTEREEKDRSKNPVHD